MVDITRIVQSYDRGVGGKTLDVFYKDEFPSKIYKKKHPHLSDGELEYIKANYLSPTKKVFGDAVFETQKIFSDKNILISCENETISTYIKDYNILGFAKDIYWQQILLDPQSVLTYHIDYNLYVNNEVAINRGNEYLPVKPYITSSANIIQSDKTSFVYKVKGDHKFNFIVWELIEDELTYKHYSFSQLEAVKPILEWNYGKIDARITRKADGIKVIEDNELVIKSYFSPSETTLSNILFDSVNLSVIEMRTVFPIPILKGEPCDEQGCNGGQVWSAEDSCNVDCVKCKGTGIKNPFSPFNTIHSIKQKGLAGGDQIQDPILSWVEPPQSAVNGLREKINKNLDICFDYLGLKYSNSDVKGSETALGKMIDREQKYSTFKMYTQDMKVMLEFVIENWIKLMFPLEKNTEFKIETRNEFKTISTAETNAIFTELQKENAPKYVLRNALNEYYTSINEPLKFEVIDRYYMYKSDDMALKYKGMGIYDTKTLVISDNIMKWVDELELSEPLNWFKIDAELKAKAAILLNEPIDTEGAILDMPAENKLRTTVGGLQGIIEIATAVATGVYDLDAAVNLVSGLYGITTEEARAWLGTPNIKDNTELDAAEKLL